MRIAITIEDIWKEFATTKSPQLRDELITTYIPLVRFVVGRLGIPSTSMFDPEDLISYGVIGLINAIDRFDPARGVRFESFASVRIRGAVIDQLRVLNWLPRSAVTRVRQIETTLATLEQCLGRNPNEHEVAADLGLSVERYRHILVEASMTILSLDAPLISLLCDDELTSLSDLLEDHITPSTAQQVERQELIGQLEEAIAALPARERLLLSLYYEQELTMKEISREMHVSESRVCQLHMQAIIRLRVSLNSSYSDGSDFKKPLRVGARRSSVVQKGSSLLAG